jgi:predicted peroxiredoxin
MAKILYVGTSGTDDPTRAGFPFNFALGAVEAGHAPEIFIAGEAAYLVKQEIASAVFPVGMPPLAEMIRKIVEHRVFVTLKVFAEKVAAADKVVST